jgi:hypothetical protein
LQERIRIEKLIVHRAEGELIGNCGRDFLRDFPDVKKSSVKGDDCTCSLTIRIPSSEVSILRAQTVFLKNKFRRPVCAK